MMALIAPRLEIIDFAAMIIGYVMIWCAVLAGLALVQVKLEKFCSELCTNLKKEPTK